MNYKIAVLLFFSFGIFSISAQENINQLTANGERTGVWKKYHNNGNIRYQGQFKNGKEVGVFKYYSVVSSKHPIIIKTFSEENKIAKVEFFSEDGALQSSGKMEGKNRIGKWVFFGSGGEIVSEENYKNGVLEGVSKTFFKNGKITEILNYKNGKLDGNIKRFADSGVLLDDLIYTNGKLNGLATYYNIDGKVIYTGIYKDDEKVGKWQYYENGKEVEASKMKQ